MTLTSRIICIEPGTAQEKRWEELVTGNPASGFMQSLSWANFKRKQGYNAIHVGVFDESELVGGALCYVPPQTRAVGLAMAPEGPVLDWSNSKIATQSLSLIVSTLSSMSKDLGIMGFHAEPRLAPPLMRSFRNFGRAPYDLIPNETLYVDLTLSEDELLNEMKPKGRYNVRLAARHGVIVSVENTLVGLDRFYQLIRAAGERDDFFVEPYEFFEDIFNSLSGSGMLKILIARHETEALAGMFYIQYGDRATYFYGGIANEKRELMAGYAMQWEAIKLAKANGMRVYDFFGFTELDDPDHPYQNFSKFKRQFGGDAKKYVGAHHHLFVSRLADAVITAAKELEREEVRL
jgi:lipid II:glycine glycyltransferase (peptidoglycan interpeptide bridge formation enzyme)